MKGRTGIFLLLLPFILSYCSCKKNEMGPNPVPYKSVYTVIDITVPQYANLQSPGIPVSLPGGNKGIIVVQDFDGTFYAFDRTCPYHINSPCGIINASIDGINFVCGSYSGKTFNACCSSTYRFNGTWSNGPTTYNLKAYQVTQSGSVLTITN